MHLLTGLVLGRAVPPLRNWAGNCEHYPLFRQSAIILYKHCYMQVELSIGNNEEQYYCQGQQLTSLTRGSTSDGLTQLTVPLSQFNCDLDRVDQVRSCGVILCANSLAALVHT